jgi:cytochrome c-type biogenesis protein CcmF
MGWGGYWAWDPVENGSLIPWLLGTAFLHSSLIEERRGMQRGWNIGLAALAFATCLFATLVTRGGIIVSELHGFATSIQPIAYFLLAAIGLVLAGTIALAYRRRSQLSSDHEVQNLLSRESSFLLLNLFFCGAAISVFLGTTFPTLSQALRGATISIQTSFYNRAVGPLLGVILALMGVCPAVGWQHASSRDLKKLVAPAAGALGLTLVAFLLGMREPFPLASAAICSFVFFSTLAVVVRNWLSRRRATGEPAGRAFLGLLQRSRRRYGAYLVHLAIVLIATGITGSTAYKQETLVSLTEGQATSVGGYTIQVEGLNMETVNAEPLTYQSKIRLSTTLGIYRGGAKVATLVAEKNLHWALENPVTEVAIHSTLKEDLYIVLADLDQSGVASFQIVINPLVSWIWIGGALLLVGTGIAAWPPKREAPEGP